ncbi:hypothetical protein [Nonomuraea basaltis]|nr:hypothetical protein [Nonomuraea basaltis]
MIRVLCLAAALVLVLAVPTAAHNVTAGADLRSCLTAEELRSDQAS